MYWSNNLGEDGSSDADAHLAGPLALCLISACAVLLICFKMPPNKKIEHAKYTVAATEEPAETEDLEDPLSEDKPEDKPVSVWRHWSMKNNFQNKNYRHF